MNSVYRDINDGLREELLQSLGRHKFRLWFRDTTVVDVGERGLTLAVPTDVHRTWLQFTFGDELQDACESVLGEGVQVRLQVSEEQERRRALRERLPQRAEAWDELLARRCPEPTLENYVARSAARFPVMILKQLLDGGTANGAACICLHGPRGSGKTHLLRALLGDSLRRRPGAAVHLTAKRFTQRYVMALRAKEMDGIRAFEVDLCSRRLVLIDDFDQLAGRKATQRELVRIMECAGGSETRFVLAGRGHPRELEDLSPRLRSRLLGGIVLALPAPDGEDLRGILEGRSRGIGVAPEPEVLTAILERTSSVHGAVEIMDRWAAASAEVGRPMSPEWLEELAPSVAATAREEVIRRAKDLVASHFGITRSLLDQPTKLQSARFPRRVAMYLVYRACALPLSELGAAFGLRSHSSVSRAIRELRELRTHDAGVEQLIDGLLSRI